MKTERRPSVRVFCARASSDQPYIKPGKIYYLRFYHGKYMIFLTAYSRICLGTVYKGTQDDIFNYLFYQADPSRRLFDLL